MRSFFILFAVVLFSISIKAQTFGINFNGAVPTGNYSDQVNLGYAVGLSLHAPVFGFTGVIYSGYGFWDEVSNPTASKFNFTNFPVVLAGARSYYGNFYLTTLAGIYPVKLTVESKNGKEEIKETQGTVLGGIGYVFPVSFFHLDASINYLWNQDYSQVQFGIGFLFNR